MRIKVPYLSVCDLAAVVGSVVGLCVNEDVLCDAACSAGKDETVDSAGCWSWDL